jgi:Flp pilus assembly protein TadG
MAQTAEVQGARKRRFRHDRGATLVEFAIIAPVLFLLVFGIIEFGWAFGQHLDVRHGAREGSRLVAVNHGMDLATPLTGSAQTDEIVAEICERMDLPAGGNPRVTLTAQDTDGDGTAGNVGDFAIVTVEHDLQTITGFLDFALSGITMQSEVQTRIERGDEDDLATWANATSQSCP